MSKAHGFVAALAALFFGCTAYPAFSATQIDIPGPAGSGTFGMTVTVLPNGNFVVIDPTYSIPGGAANVGAVYLYSGATLTVISTLTGSTANDQVGYGIMTVLANGNYVVRSDVWNNGAVTKAGAVTWGSATAGVSGTVSSANSLIGSTANDKVGSNGAIALTNGNYVVVSTAWNNGAAQGGVALQAGAVTWGDGTHGVSGAVTSGNSLVGSTANDQVGTGGVIALVNGNYVVRSGVWNNGAATKAGAVTWGNGTFGVSGPVTPVNSLVGSSANDLLGYFAGVTALTNGNYVVASYTWSNSTGAATWGSGTGGVSGPVTQLNSLIGSTPNNGMGTGGDQVGDLGVTALTNGNYVVGSGNWNNQMGAATWGNGTTGVSGKVASGNSLVGGTATGAAGSVTALTNGNYVVASAALSGKVTWCDGTKATSATISASNSLVGSAITDGVGSGGVKALTNGNYVVASPFWSNGATDQVGAVTWCNGASVTVGTVSPGNSLVGSTAYDQVGYNGVTALTNGNYVVASSMWSNGALTYAGAVTWGNGAGGTAGPVSVSNSLLGSTAFDQVGYDTVITLPRGVTALSNGNYVVASPNWNNGVATQGGAATWGNGNGGTAGPVSPVNSLAGSTANDAVASEGVTALTNGDYVVFSEGWNNPQGPLQYAGAVSYGVGTGGTTGLITSGNSVLGTVAGGVNTFSFDTFRNRLFVGRAASNIVTIFVPYPLVVASNPTAAPNPAAVGQTVTFTASVSSGTGALTYTWNFGDSSPTATGGSVTYAYPAVGSYTATVTVTDLAHGSISATTLVTVNAPLVGTGTDSDGDGFSDAFETAVGTDPTSAASTPTGSPITAAGVQTLTISKALINVNFAKAGSDSISFSGTVAVPADFNPATAKTYFYVGGVGKTLELSAKGSGASGGDSVKVTLKAKKGVVSASPAAKYSVTFKKGTFAAMLAGAGLTNANAKAASVMVPFTFIFNNTVYQKTQTMSYTAKQGKSGSAQ